MAIWAAGRKFARLVTLSQDVGLWEVGSRILGRLLGALGVRGRNQQEWLRQKQDGDVAFDEANRTDTGGIQSIFDLNVVGGNARYAVNHVASDPPSFVSLMETLPLDLSEFCFVDLGSGKGRALIMAAAFPFRRIIGVEFAAEFNDAARLNLQASAERGLDISRIDIVLEDAAAYSFPLEPLIIYLFNPFGSKIVRQVAQNAIASWRTSPRPVQMLYMNPVHLNELVDCGWYVAETSNGWVRLVPERTQ